MNQSMLDLKKLFKHTFGKFNRTKVAYLSLSFTCFFASLLGQTDREQVDFSSEKACAQEILLAYFPETIVDETLKRFHIADDKRLLIIQQLVLKEKEIVFLVQKKVLQLHSNSLKDPSQKQMLVKIYRETLLEVLTEALAQGNITDKNQIKKMLEDIQQQKAKYFASCLEKRQQEIESP